MDERELVEKVWTETLVTSEVQMVSWWSLVNLHFLFSTLTTFQLHCLLCSVELTCLMKFLDACDEYEQG